MVLFLFCPNAPHARFTVKMYSDNKNDEIGIRITDMYGRVIQSIDKRRQANYRS